jgi:hypothetical protein
MNARVVCSRFVMPVLLLVILVLPRRLPEVWLIRGVVLVSAVALVLWPELAEVASRCRGRVPAWLPPLGRRLRRLLLGVTIALVVDAGTAANALADPGQFGKNLGDQVRGLSTGLFLAVAGLVALPILGRRDVNGGVVLFGLVVVLGGFIFSQDMVKHVITDLWHGLPDQSS